MTANTLLKKVSRLPTILGLMLLLAVGGTAGFAQSSSQPRLVVAFSASNLGFGVQAAKPVTRRSDIHGGFNFNTYSWNFRKDIATFNDSLNREFGNTSHDNLKLSFFNLQYDQYLVAGLHLSGGAMIWKGNEGKATIGGAGSGRFTVGGATYYSASFNTVIGTSTLSRERVSPLLLIGYENLTSKGHLAYSVDTGIAFQGSANAELSLYGTVCSVDQGETSGPCPFTTVAGSAMYCIGNPRCENVATSPSIQRNIAAEEAQIKSDLSPHKYYPVVQFTVGYKFK